MVLNAPVPVSFARNVEEQPPRQIRRIRTPHPVPVDVRRIDAIVVCRIGVGDRRAGPPTACSSHFRARVTNSAVPRRFPPTCPDRATIVCKIGRGRASKMGRGGGW
jgi:hypothetical protein